MDGQFQDLIDRLCLLSGQFGDIQGLIRKAIRLADNDPEMALTRVRKVLEYVVHDAYQLLVKEPPGTKPLENLLQRLVKDGHLPPHLTPYTTFIRELGNAGTHRPDGNYKMLDVNVSLIQLRAILDWYFQTVRPDTAAIYVSPDQPKASGEPPQPAGSGSLVGQFLDQAGENKVASSPMPTPEPVASPAPLPERRRRRWRLIVAASVLSVLLLGVIVYVSTNPPDFPKLRDPSQPPKSLAETNPPPKADDAFITNTLGMKLKLIPAGEFSMGSDETDPDATSNEKVNGKKHRVRITRPFYLGTTEVTVGQFRRFVESSGYKTEAEGDGKGGYGWDEQVADLKQAPKYTWWSLGFAQTDDHPVVNVSWNDALAFCDWLGIQEGQTYRLPREAEWEYGCRAGQATRYGSGDDPETLATVGNVLDGTAKGKYPEWAGAIKAKDGFCFTAPVGLFRPNEFGLCDMHGNVWEWCADWYDSDYYAKSPSADPLNSSQATSRVIRGGGWDDSPRYCRSAYRGGYAPGTRSLGLGFRVLRVRSGP